MQKQFEQSFLLQVITDNAPESLSKNTDSSATYFSIIESNYLINMMMSELEDKKKKGII